MTSTDPAGILPSKVDEHCVTLLWLRPTERPRVDDAFERLEMDCASCSACRQA
jgi:hypothetical protein